MLTLLVAQRPADLIESTSPFVETLAERRSGTDLALWQCTLLGEPSLPPVIHQRVPFVPSQEVPEPQAPLLTDVEEFMEEEEEGGEFDHIEIDTLHAGDWVEVRPTRQQTRGLSARWWATACC